MTRDMKLTYGMTEDMAHDLILGITKAITKGEDDTKLITGEKKIMGMLEDITHVIGVLLASMMKEINQITERETIGIEKESVKCRIGIINEGICEELN